ncbi:MAG: NAD(P)H-hydrate epimerase [Planctomycetota bacterium]
MNRVKRMVESVPLTRANQLGWPVLSVQQSRDVDARAIAHHGMTGQTLMQNAGSAAAKIVLTRSDVANARVIILAGPGNNGGDGYVIATELVNQSVDVSVLSCVPLERLRGDARWAHSNAMDAGVAIRECIEATSMSQRLSGALEHPGPVIVVDCMLGTGSQGPPREPMSTAIEIINRRRQQGSVDHTVAIDLPTGMDGDSGMVASSAFHADLTLTFVTGKRGMLNCPDQGILGDVQILDIGLPQAMRAELGIAM